MTSVLLLTVYNNVTEDVTYFAPIMDEGCDEYIFEIEDQFYSVYHWDDEPLKVSQNEDGYFASNQRFRRKYEKRSLPYSSQQFGTIEMSNSNSRLRYDVMKGWLYNVLVEDGEWTTGLYMIDGTYAFRLSEEENRLFNNAVAYFIENIEPGYYPTEGSYDYRSYTPGALYLKVSDISGATEYYGSLWDDPCEFRFLDQLVITIIERNISEENKVSDEILLTDIRERFNYFMLRDSVTGSGVYDGRQILEELKEKGLIQREGYQ